MGLSTRLAKSTPPQIPSHAIHPNSRHLFGIRQHREFYSAQDFKTDQEPPLNSFYKHASKPQSIYPIRRLSFGVLNSVRCCRRSKCFPVGYRRGSPSGAAGNELNHMHESFLVEQPRAPSDYQRTYMYSATRAEPLSDAAWAFPVEWIRLTNALKIGASFPGFYFLQITRLARLPLLTPRTTTSGQSLPAKKIAFSTLRPESLTHPGCELPSPVRWQRVPPDYPTLPFRLYLSDSESWSPVGRRREPPGQATLPFPPHGRRGLPIQTASIFLRSDVGESLLATQLAFPSLPVQHSESWSPVGRRREPPGQTTLPFKPVARWGLPVRHGNSETTVGHRREPPGQTNFPFSSCGRQGLPNHAAGWLRGLPTPKLCPSV